jgi:hypothetical protein
MDAAGKLIGDVVVSSKGKVISIEEDCVIVNLGLDKGVSDSSEFEIKRSTGKVITDPDTGEVLSNGSKVVCRAHVVKGSVESKICRIVPGYWKPVKILLGTRNEWRPDPDKLKEIKERDEVITVAPPKND